MLIHEWVLIIITIVLVLLGYTYDRSSRYSYLASRWNDLGNMNVDEPDFFNPEKTVEYQNTFDEKKKTKYCQHARMHWGFVEDAIRKDYLFERWWIESFVEAYRDTIADCIKLHHAWLRDNKDRLFTYNKFRHVLRTKFGEELKQASLEL